LLYHLHAMRSSNQSNIFADVPELIPSELFEAIAETQTIKIERIISKGHQSEPDFWYDQEQSEWVLVLKGAARLEFEDRFVTLQPGDYINIEPHQKHRVDWTTPDKETIWLAIFY
jgi:cupin 2 domain-containing protein